MGRPILRTLVIARTPGEIEALEEKWRALYCTQSEAQGSTAQSEGPTLFQSFAWNLLAARIFGDRETPYVVHADSDSGAALIPAAIRKKNKMLTFLGEELFDYRDFLSAGASSAAAAAWEALLDLRLPLAESVLPNSNLHAVPLKKKFFTHAPRLAGIAADEFARSHSRSAARLRRIFRRGVRLKRVAGNVSGLAKWIYQRKAHIDSASLFRDPLRIAFMEAVCRQENCEISVLEAERTPGSCTGDFPRAQHPPFLYHVV